ncbi:MAG: UDP-glucose/GDP-mannose dehydrogenase family protein [Nitrospirae bacterium]|nr:UDP-glucose/GDP-mannose dehydrogenase family protein [Nitrospirota bacterium]MBF0539940.1 UDP-glucose/GDP-mannose dehydrogenase family protein [Nitrospirota bacterium]
MHIGVIGTGYVGLVTGACFAEFGVMVTCVDNDASKIASLNRGEIPFFEPGLEELVKRNMKEDRLRFSSEAEDAIKSSLVIFIAVGTPPRGDGSADLSYVEGVACQIAKNLDNYKVIVTKSTVPVGTGKKLREIINKESNGKAKFDVVSNPEFLREGAAIEDFMRPNRVVIGSESDQATAIMKDLYGPLYLIETPIVITNIETAELIKYASNSFLAVKISFINELANLCEQVGADVNIVAKGMGLDKRIGSKFLHAGAGYGGSCFPKDTRALLSLANDRNINLSVVSASVSANDVQKTLMLKKIKDAGGILKDKTFAILGLSFKPNTDDIREAPAIYIIEELLKEGVKIKAYDPTSMHNASLVIKDIYYAKDPYDALNGVDAVVLITEWNQFRNLDLDKVKSLMKTPLFFDLRNVYEPIKMRDLGFEFYCVGRGIK